MIPNPIKKRSSGKQEEIPLVQWDDARLLKSFVVSGNREALRVIIERYGAMVMTICKRATAQHADAEDAFQATFLILVQRAGKIRKQKSLAGWLFQVARRTAVRARQRQRNRRELTVFSDQEPISNQNLFAEIAQEFEAEQIDIVLAGLPEKYRDPLVMFHFQQMSVSEICEAMNSTQGSVEGLLKRGRSELKRRLQQAGITLSSFAIVTLLSQSQIQAGQSCSAGLIDQTVSALAESTKLTTTFPESIEQLAQQEWMPMLTKSAIAKSILITSAALSIAIMAGSAFVVGEPPKGESAINTQLRLEGNAPTSDASDDDIVTDDLTVNEKQATEENTAKKTAKKPTENRSDAWKEKFRQALKEETNFEFIETPLSDVTQLIGEQHGINIRLDTLALEEAGIPTDEPVNLIISGISLQSALNIMFENMPNEELDYILEDEVMKITTRAKADELLEVRFYPIPKGLRKSPYTMSRTGSNGALGLGMSSSTMETGSADIKDPQLIDFVMDMVDDFGSWKRDGGLGTIWIVGNSLAVRQTQRVHRKLEKFWNELEAQMAEETDATLVQPQSKYFPISGGGQDGSKDKKAKSDSAKQGGGGGFF